MFGRRPTRRSVLLGAAALPAAAGLASVATHSARGSNRVPNTAELRRLNTQQNTMPMPGEPMIHGAMDGYDLPQRIRFSLDATRMQRLRRLQRELRKDDLPAAILLNPVNTRYATDTSDMSGYSMHFETRLAFVPADETMLSVIYDYAYLAFLSSGYPTVYPAEEHEVFAAYYYFAEAQRSEDFAKKFARDIDALMVDYAEGSNIVAVDGLSQLGVAAIEALTAKNGQRYKVVTAQPAIQRARSIKLDTEVDLLRYGVESVYQPTMSEINALTDDLAGRDITENHVLSMLLQHNIANGGEWMEPRQVTLGARTYPALREASGKLLADGDLLSIMTDMVSCWSYQINCGRSWVVGNKVTDRHKWLYKVARRQIAANIANLAVGKTFRELSQQSFDVPEAYRANQTTYIYKGVGMSDEWPFIPNKQRWDKHGYDGELKAGMVLSVPAYISDSSATSAEPLGIKLETMVHLTDAGVQEIDCYRYDPHLS